MLMSKNVNNDVSKDSPMELPFVRREVNNDFRLVVAS